MGSAGTPGCAPAAFCTASCSLDIPSSSAGSDALESDDVVERLTAAASASSRIISAPLICAIALRSTDSASPESVRPSSMSPPFLSSLSEPGALESGAVAAALRILLLQEVTHQVVERAAPRHALAAPVAK